MKALPNQNYTISKPIDLFLGTEALKILLRLRLFFHNFDYCLFLSRKKKNLRNNCFTFNKFFFFFLCKCEKKYFFREQTSLQIYVTMFFNWCFKFITRMELLKKGSWWSSFFFFFKSLPIESCLEISLSLFLTCKLNPSITLSCLHNC